ncbi:MAG TPA: dihydrodipicolinate synthase family protein [Micromonosporaceae bacterium]|nr:dihydrodipicolinate synthase family protein [Micromonosporaceae bacterium]
MMPLWTGPAVALVTLFDADGSLATEATAAHAARLVELGVRAVVVNGTTGEAAAMTDGERAALVTAVKAACPTVPVVAGASGEWWEPATTRVAAAVKAGADAVLVAPPRFGDSVEQYYRHVAEAVAGVPVLAYNWPGVAGGEVSVDALPELPVAGVKDSTASADRLIRQIDLAWSGAVYTGSAALIGFTGWVGGAGAIVGAANFVPEECLAAWDGDAAAQRRVVRAVAAAGSRFPRSLKEATAQRFGTPATCRLG